MFPLHYEASRQRIGEGQNDGGNIIKILTEHHFSRRIPPQKTNVNQQDSMLSAASITKDERLYTTVNPVMLLCMSKGVSRTTMQRKMTEAM